MKTISFTLLAISAAVVTAIPGTDNDNERNLRGSAVQDFQNYVKAQYSDDYFKPADVTSSPVVGSDPNPAYLPSSLDNDVENAVDASISKAGEGAGKAAMVDAQKFLEEAEAASLGTSYCRGNDSACYTYNSHFCCSGICIRHQSSSPFGYCAPTTAADSSEELIDTTESKAKEETNKASISVAKDLKFLEETEEASINTNQCRVNGALCYDSDLCCSGICKRQHFSDSAPGTCAPAAAVDNLEELIDTTEYKPKEEADKASIAKDQKFLEETGEASIGTNYCRDWGACYSFSPFFCCSGICNLYNNGTPLGECEPSTAIAKDQEFLEDTKEKITWHHFLPWEW